MTKNELRELLVKGKFSLLIGYLEKTSSQLDQELKQEVLLQVGRFHQYIRQKRSGLLTHEEQAVEFAKINQALLEVIEELPLTQKGPRARIKKSSWLIGSFAVGVIAVITFWVVRSEENKKLGDIQIEEQGIIEADQAPSYKEAKAATDSIVSQPKRDEALDAVGQGKSESRNKQAEKGVEQKLTTPNGKGNTVFYNPTINGPVITKPSGTININIDNSGKKDTINEK